MAKNPSVDNQGINLGGGRPAANLAALIYGILDGAAGVAYAVNAPVIAWHGAVVFLKLTILIFSARRIVRPSVLGFAMTLSIIVIILASLAAGTGSDTGTLGAGAFAGELFLTLLLVGPKNVETYAKGVSVAVAMTALLHIGFSFTGRVVKAWGRYMYFNAGQPNLGGEIAAMGAIAALIGFRRLTSLILIGIMTADTLLLQSRSALLTEGACIVVALIFDNAKQLTPRRALMLGVATTMGILFIMAVGVGGSVGQVFGDVFQTTSQTRGFSTGFSGREQLWPIAIELFKESPFIGHGLGYYNEIGYLGPHNIVLYGLGEDGLSSLTILGCIFVGFVYASRRELHVFATICCSVPLLMFNDRFVNLNTYPFVLYLLLAIVANMPRRRGNRSQIILEGSDAGPAHSQVRGLGRTRTRRFAQ